MIGSRAVTLLKNVSRCSRNTQLVSTNLQQVRHSHGAWMYREMSTPPKWASVSADICGSVLWFWIWWNMYHSWGHIVGVYEGKLLPNPYEWTDEELGIPADDA